jgi:hypothetical protein
MPAILHHRREAAAHPCATSFGTAQGDRGIVVEVGHGDKELPLQLMLVVGDLGSDPVTT